MSPELQAAAAPAVEAAASQPPEAAANEEKKDKPAAEEDLLAQLLEAQKQMQLADQELNQLNQSQLDIQNKISVQEKALKK